MAMDYAYAAFEGYSRYDLAQEAIYMDEAYESLPDEEPDDDISWPNNGSGNLYKGYPNGKEIAARLNDNEVRLNFDLLTNRKKFNQKLILLLNDGDTELNLANQITEIQTKIINKFFYNEIVKNSVRRLITNYGKIEKLPSHLISLAEDEKCIQTLIHGVLTKYAKLVLDAKITGKISDFIIELNQSRHNHISYELVGHLQKFIHKTIDEYYEYDIAHLNLDPKMMRETLSTARLHYYILEMKEHDKATIIGKEHDTYEFASKYFAKSQDRYNSKGDFSNNQKVDKYKVPITFGNPRNYDADMIDKTKKHYKFWKLQHIKPAMEYLDESEKVTIVHYIILLETLLYYFLVVQLTLKESIELILKLNSCLLTDAAGIMG